MADNDNKKRFIKDKHFKTVLVISMLIVLLIVILTNIYVDKDLRAKSINDSLFSVAILFLILAVFIKATSWSYLKRGLKYNDDDVLYKSERLSFYSKAFSLIGSVNLLVSILTLIVYY